MLEPWIIEQIRRREEEEERRRNERPQLEIPIHDDRRERWHDRNDKGRNENERPDDPDRERDRERGDRNDRDEDQPERGVMIIDFGVG